MNSGAILIGLAALVMLVAYVMQPFRRRAPDMDALIERWVSDARKGDENASAQRTAASSESRDMAVRPTPEPFRRAPVASCPNCGKPVKPEYHFCRNCGVRLGKG